MNMSFRRENEAALVKLVEEFEKVQQNGQKPCLDEKTFELLITYYEDQLKFNKALDVLNIALEHHSDSASLHIKKANLLLITRNSQLAMSTLDIAQSISPQTTSIQLLKVKILATMEKHNEALAVVNEIKGYGSDSDKSQVYYTESLIYELMKDYDSMFRVLEESLYLDPENNLSLEKVWVCSELTRNYERCIDFHKNLIDIHPYNFMAWYNLGQAYSCLGENNKAIEAYEYVTIINPSFEPVYEEIAELYRTEENHTKALDTYFEQLNILGPDHEIYKSIGESYLQLKDYTLSKLYLHKALKLDHYNDELMYSLGVAYFHTCDYDNAYKYLAEAVNIEDRNEEYFMYLGLTLVELEQYAKANYFLRKATEIGPDLNVVWINYVRFLFEYETLQIVYKTIEKGLNHVEECDLSVIMISLQYANGDKNKAIEDLIELFEDDYCVSSDLINEFCPEMLEDQKVYNIMRYYQENQD